MTSSMPTAKRIARLGWFLSIFIFFMFLLSLNAYSTDDAFISFRYAKNLADGHGLVYNPGQPPVEGYTNFLWTVLLAGVAFVNLPIPESAIFLSVFFGLLTLLLTGGWIALQKHFLPDISGSGAMLILALCPFPALWSVTGMETTFFSFLIVLASLIMVWESWYRRIGWLSGLIWAAAALTRPEGIMIGGLIILLSYLESGQLKFNFRSFLVRLGTFLVPIILHFIWRYYFYHDWFPNTFYAKIGSPDVLIPKGYEYFMSFLKAGGAIPLALVILSVLIRPRIVGAWTLFLTSAAYILYVIHVGGDWMPGFRFFVPLLPLWAAVSTLVLFRIHKWKPFLSFLLGAVMLLHIGLAGFNNILPFSRHSLLRQYIWGEEPPVDILKELGLHLKEIAEPYSLLAVIPAGKVPFYSGLPTLDMRGLCDRHIARSVSPTHLKHTLVGHLKRDPQYVLDQKPVYIVLSGATLKPVSLKDPLTDRPPGILDQWDIAKLPEFSRCYQPVRVDMPRGEKDLLYYKRICLN